MVEQTKYKVIKFPKWILTFMLSILFSGMGVYVLFNSTILKMETKVETIEKNVYQNVFKNDFNIFLNSLDRIERKIEKI